VPNLLPCSFGEGSPPWPSNRRVIVTRRVAFLMNGACNIIIFMYQMAYGYHFSHSNAHVTAISSFIPSSTACPVGVQFLPWKRGGSALRTSTTTHCEMLLWSREHRGSMAMYISSIDRRLRKTLRRCLAGAKKKSWFSCSVPIGRGEKRMSGSTDNNARK
jgi:hypothetical protein